LLLFLKGRKAWPKPRGRQKRGRRSKVLAKRISPYLGQERKRQGYKTDRFEGRDAVALKVTGSRVF